MEQETKLRFLDVSGLPRASKCGNIGIFGGVVGKGVCEVTGFTKLKFLDVSGCYELEELPNMETLVSLEYLWAEGCVKVKRIRGLEHLTKLKRLRLPTPVGGCTELQELSLEVCMEPKRIQALEGVGAGDKS